MDPKQPNPPQDDEQAPQGARSDGGRIIARDTGPLYFRLPDWFWKKNSWAEFTPEEKEQIVKFFAPIDAALKRQMALAPYRRAALQRLPQWARERVLRRQGFSFDEERSLWAEFVTRYPKLAAHTNPFDAIANFRWNEYKTLIHHHRELALPPRLDDAPDFAGPKEEGTE